MLKKCWDSCAAGCAADLRGEKRGALQVGRGTLLASREACFDMVADVCLLALLAGVLQAPLVLVD